ncbi:MAG: thermopsin family protease, partial [Thermoplasmata archaeon]
GLGAPAGAAASPFSVSSSAQSQAVGATSGSVANSAQSASTTHFATDVARADLVNRARQAFIDNNVSLNDFFPPNLNAAPGPTGATDGHIVPLYDYAAAPLGVSTFGLENTTGTTTPYILNTTSLLGTFSTSDPEGLQVLSPYYGTLQSYGDQLNTVLNNTTILGTGGYDFWLQNVITYTSSTNTLRFENNIWNFSSPSGIFPSNSILHGLGRVESEEVYEESGPSITIAYPFTLDLYLNTTVGSYDGSPFVNEAYFNYTVINAAGQVVCPTTEPTGESCSNGAGGHGGMYDNVYFNSATNVPFGSAEISANGEQYTPLGLPSDMEMDVGIGQSDGANANVVYSNATVGLYTLNATTDTYQAPPSAYDFGSETGETGAGASVSWATVNGQPVAYERTGPSLLTGLWNVTGGTDGAPSIGTAAEGAFALNYAGVSPGNAFLAIAQGSGTTNQAMFQVAPTFGWFTGKGQLGQNLWLPTGNYTVEVMLSGYNQLNESVSLTANTALSATLVRSATPTVYTPLWAYSNSDLANLSTSGAGTSGSPYVLPGLQPGSLAPVFAILNDYLFIVYSGIWINATTANFQFNPAPSLEITEPTWWYFQTEGLAAAYGSTLLYNQLPMYFYHTSNFVVENSAGIGLWSSDIEVGHNYAVYCNLCSDSLWASNTFNVSSEGIEFLGSGTSQNNYVWGNTFTPFSDPAEGGMSAPSTGLVLSEGGDHIYNNAFYTNRTLTSTSTTLVNVFEAAGGYQPASNSVTVNGVALTGSILGGPVQGGNYYRDYGALANPYGVIPYVGRQSSPTGSAGIGSGGDFAPLTLLPGSCNPCLETAGLYKVTLTETGVTASKTWTAKVIGVPVYEPLLSTLYTSPVTNTSTTTPTTSLSFWLPNGTYAFTVSTTATGIGPAGNVWSFSVNGAAVNPPTIVFEPTYAVTFSEHGLPFGINWQVTVNGVTGTVAGNGANQSLSFSEVSGSYEYTIAPIAGWTQSTLPPSGFLTVSGAPVAEPRVLYTEVTYSVTFSENGLPAGQTWGVTLNGVTGSLTTVAGTNSIEFTGVPDGTYSYSIAAVSGWHESAVAATGIVVVNGAAVSVSMTYTEVTYSATFSEEGLPSGLPWQVTLNSVEKTLTTDGGTDSLTFTGLPNGTYSYTVADNPGYHQSTLPYTGSVSVDGAAVSEPALVYGVTTYSVTFSESGLPVGLTWQVTVNGVPMSTVTDGGTDSLTFTGLANGTYAYSIADNGGWHQTTLAYAGTVGVSGAPVAEPTLVYTAVTYKVAFVESGLPTGTSWSVTLGAQTVSSTTTKVVFHLVNGSYTYSIGLVAGYEPKTASGTFVVAATPVKVSVPFKVTTYVISFKESGLPSGTSWSVTLTPSSGPPTTVTSTVVMLRFHEPNGTYNYSVTPISGYHISSGAYSGSVTVNGAAPATIVDHWTLVKYAVSFTETGLPHGTSWQVVINGHTYSTTGTTITVNLPNGTYAFTVSAVGYTGTPNPSSPLIVSGAAVPVTVSFAPGSEPRLVGATMQLQAGVSRAI